jgi:hypothetical protein
LPLQQTPQNRRDGDWKKVQKLLTARGAAEDMKIILGGDTGLLMKRVRKIGSGKDAQLVEEYEVGTGGIKSERA